MYKIKMKVLALIAILILVSGCSGQSRNNSDVKLNQPTSFIATELLVTSNYGFNTLENKQVKIRQGSTVLELLKTNSDVVTDSQGNFVVTINGIGEKNNSQYGWFYYVNGIGATKGAGEYKLSDGDKVWWDYHGWYNVPMYNAVIGSYPSPFINSNLPVNIIVTDNALHLGEMLKNSLEELGISNVKINVANNSSLEARTGPSIVIGTWEKVDNYKYLAQLNKPNNKAGINIWFNDYTVNLFDDTNNINIIRNDSCGAIVAFDEGLGSGLPIWLVTGNDEQGLESVVSLLSNEPEKIKGKYGIALFPESNELIALPVVKGK